MKTLGIVAEYDPFHLGHAWHIARSRALLGEDCPVVAVMSGNWTQRASCALADKWTRGELALGGGVDLVLELPTLWAAASAERFARGAVELLRRSGVVEVLSFGSECGDLEALREVAQCLNSPECQGELHTLVRGGLSFAAARQRAVERLLGPERGKLLEGPNNNLGVEYLRALGPELGAMTVPRRGAPHGARLLEGAPAPAFASAAQIRSLLRQGRGEEAEAFLLPGTRERLGREFPSMALAERAVLLRVRSMGAEDWARLPDAGVREGLPNRLERSGRSCRSVEEFCQLARSRRYPHARIRRLLLWAFLGLGREDLLPAPPYLRVLAFNTRGRELLREMGRRASLPVLTNTAQVRQLSKEGQRCFALEAQCTDRFGLCLPQISQAGSEWREYARYICSEPTVLNR